MSDDPPSRTGLNEGEVAQLRRAYEDERAARLQLEHVQAVTDAALTHLELDDLLAELLSRIRSILGSDTCAILLLDEERQELVARAAVGLEEEVERGVRIPLGRGFAGRVAAECRPIVLDDVDHADVLNPILREHGIKSLLGAPLIVRDAAIGVVHVGTLRYRAFEQADVDLLQLVADRAALAIEKARVYRELLELDQLKMNFVAVASHELRTPAASVYGVLATLDERGDELSPAQQRELIASGHKQADRLRRLIEQLLDLSRLDARTHDVNPEPLVLHTVVSEVVASVVGDAPALDLRLIVPQDLAVVADRLVIERVLSNLLVNATRYGAPPIVVSAEQRDRHLRISVEDSGGGVAEEIEQRLFDRFERGRDAKGSGLGLSIAKAYAQAHGGDVVYEPREQGARFELIVPHG